MLINLTKKIAHSGLCSRREAKALVMNGEVKVNGMVVCVPTTQVNLEDKITVQNKPLQNTQEPKIWLFHKPAGFITTTKDPQKRATIFDILPKNIPRVISIGRLDINSEGLLLLTNNGDLARYFELPKNALVRKYHVRVFGHIDTNRLNSLAKGCEIDGTKYGKIEATVIKQGPSNAWLEMSITEGKNREIRKILGDLGLKISKLKRVQYGEYFLGTIKKGEIRPASINIKQELYENHLRKT